MSAASARARLQAELLRDFPIAQALHVTVEQCDDESIVLRAPLEPNLNAGGTFFGGSIGGVAMLTGWACCHRISEKAGLSAAVVIQHADIRFVRPATSALIAACRMPAPSVCEHWVESLTRHHKARLTLEMNLSTESGVVAQFTGRYVGFA